jgi:hypothetical protein
MVLHGRSKTDLTTRLPMEVECALRRVLMHYWDTEQQSHARLPKYERAGHIFESIRLIDDWLFAPTAKVQPEIGKTPQLPDEQRPR